MQLTTVLSAGCNGRKIVVIDDVPFVSNEEERARLFSCLIAAASNSYCPVVFLYGEDENHQQKRLDVGLTKVLNSLCQFLSC